MDQINFAELSREELLKAIGNLTNTIGKMYLLLVVAAGAEEFKADLDAWLSKIGVRVVVDEGEIEEILKTIEDAAK